ncbi:hypothetical protein ZYGR_0N03290 [Zygosaccharomyces rouxii]|uniref:Uncharacterized protein n=1 Tax=Zygosaccharomyces rouxii TaxID=4956 RepID=A0A1Q2ZZQ5_ZYGRO|nr:hypothetical protein ZYGR_0N03290 [Zygosaccharomyces rouxii]
MPFNIDMVEPPPELPLHSFLMDPPKSRKRIVNKLKGLLAPSKEFVPRDEFEDIPLRPPAFPLVEDSTKTFLTGNVEPMGLQQQHQQQQEQERQRQHDQQQRNQHQQAKSGIAIPHSIILGDPSAFSNFSSSLHIKHIGLRSCVKRLNTIAQRKLETSKCTQKFLRDLISWGQNSSFDSLDSLELVNEIQLIFQQDLINEQNIAQRLKLLASELDFVCIREQELAQERKNLAISLKKHRYALEKKGEHHDETILLKEKVIAHERAFESYKSHYQFAVSITARHAFKELGIDLYERASDLKETTGEFLRITLQALESVDGDGFVKDLEKIRIVRAERSWAKLSREQKTNPQSWVDLVSGKKDGDDTLMQKVYQGLPKEYSPLEPRINQQELKLDFPTTELDESTSAIQSGRFNPITSNEYFSPRTGQQENDTKREKLKNDVKETIVRSVDPNVVRNVTGGVPAQRHREETKPPPQNDNPNGFILNFSNISQQFDDAEKHLQENRWLD